MMDIIGHEKIILSFYKAIESQTLSHAHLIVGEDGIGKSIIAHNFALKLLDKKDDRKYADIIEYRTSKKSIGVNEIRDLIEEINKKPYEGDKKVIIVYEGNKLTVQAQNAFLKTIEESPKGVYIIILCENLGAILDTIKSRCHIHKLNRLSPMEIKEFIVRKYDYIKEDELSAIIAFSNGIPGRAEKFIEDSTFNEIRSLAIRLIMDLNIKDLSEMLKYESELTKFKDNYEEILINILIYIRDIMIYKELGNEKHIVNIDKIEEIKEASHRMSYNKLNALAKLVNDTKYSLDSNVNTAMTFDVMLLNMLEV